jgi:hypothetical protein
MIFVLVDEAELRVILFVIVVDSEWVVNLVLTLSRSTSRGFRIGKVVIPVLWFIVL